MRDENALVLAENRVAEVLDKFLQNPLRGLPVHRSSNRLTVPMRSKAASGPTVN